MIRNLINHFSNLFGFPQKYTTTHVLIHLTDKIRHEIDKGNFAYGIFEDFQKDFDAVDHHKLLKYLECYGIRRISNIIFCSIPY